MTPSPTREPLIEPLRVPAISTTSVVGLGETSASPSASTHWLGGAPKAALETNKFVHILALTKPRITLTVTFTTLAGIGLALRSGYPGIGLTKLLVALLGTVLIVSAANVFNMVLERDTDALMDRTKNRPLPSGKVEPFSACVAGAVFFFASLPLLFSVNALTGGLALLAFGSYVFVYTLLKRRTSASLPIGAIPGAIPPLMGFAAVANVLAPPAWALFLLLFMWQLPHFLAIALFRHDDYERAGLKTLPVERGEKHAIRRVFLYSCLLLPTSLLLPMTGVVGFPYVILATGFGGIFIGLSTRAPQTNIRPWARKVFAFSIVYLVVLFAAVVIRF